MEFSWIYNPCKYRKQQLKHVHSTEFLSSKLTIIYSLNCEVPIVLVSGRRNQKYPLMLTFLNTNSLVVWFLLIFLGLHNLLGLLLRLSFLIIFLFLLFLLFLLFFLFLLLLLWFLLLSFFNWLLFRFFLLLCLFIFNPLWCSWHLQYNLIKISYKRLFLYKLMYEFN